MKRNNCRPFQERHATARACTKMCDKSHAQMKLLTTHFSHIITCVWSRYLALFYYMHLKQHFFLSASFRFSLMLTMYEKNVYFLGLCDYIFDSYAACLTLSFNTAYVNFHSIPFTSRFTLESKNFLKVVCPPKLPLGS